MLLKVDMKLNFCIRIKTIFKRLKRQLGVQLFDQMKNDSNVLVERESFNGHSMYIM